MDQACLMKKKISPVQFRIKQTWLRSANTDAGEAGTPHREEAKTKN